MRLRKNLLIVSIIINLSAININAKIQPVCEDEFVKSCYIDTTRSKSNSFSGLEIYYCCNGYNNHWQVFVTSKGKIVLGFESEIEPIDSIISLGERNNSGLVGYAVVDWSYKKGKSFYPRKIIHQSSYNILQCPFSERVCWDNCFGLSDSIFNYHFNIQNQDREIKKTGESLLSKIPFSYSVINPDNILYSSRSFRSMDEIHIWPDNDIINGSTCLGGYVKVPWSKLYDEKNDTYNYSYLDKYFALCIERNTRLTLRIDQTDGAWDDHFIIKPHNWYVDSAKICAILDRYGKWKFDNDNKLVINGKLVTGNYPSKLFFLQLLEGDSPVIKNLYGKVLKYDIAASFFDYNSETVYFEYKKMLEGLYSYLNENELLNRYNEKIKYKYLIENLYAAIGVTGEGYVKSYGVFPRDKHKMMRYFYLYNDVFYDLPLSFPLAVYYDIRQYGIDNIRKIWNMTPDKGPYEGELSGIWYDVIGQKGYVPYSKLSGSIAPTLIQSSATRRWCGEGAFNDSICSQVLTHAYTYHFSGVSQHNFPFGATPKARNQQKKFITLAGAKLHISICKLKGDTLRYTIQNIGGSKVFSPFWTPVLIFRNNEGNEIGRNVMKLNLRSILPNSQRYDSIGLYKENIPERIEVLNTPPHTDTISFAIIDKYGIYENYWLHNYGRISFSLNDDERKVNGEYIIWTKTSIN